MAPGSRPARARLAVVALVALIGVLSGCGDDVDEPTPTSTTEAAPSTTTTEAASVDDEAAVLEGDAAAWDASVAALTANPVVVDAPDVLSTIDGRALSGLRNTLSGLSERGHHFGSLALDRAPQVESIDGDEAVVVDCIAERSTIVANGDGAVVEEIDAVYAVRVIMERRDDAWVRISLTSEEDPTCGG